MVSQQSDRLVRLVNKRVLFLCVAFIGWSIFGLRQLDDLWVGYVKWWGVLFYVLVHMGLAGLILRTTGLRLWSFALCAVGFAIGRDAYLTFFAFSVWKFGGFAP